MFVLLAGDQNPLGHVKDEPLFHFGPDDYGWQQALHHQTGEFFEKLYLDWGIGKNFLMFVLAGLVTVLLFWIRARQVRKETVPGRFGNALEAIMLYLRDQVVRPFLGHHGDKFLPFTWAFFFFILINNLLGLIPFFDYLGHGGNTATANIGITAALALCSFTLYHTIGIKEQGGPVTYIKNLFPHVPVVIYVIIIPVEIVAHIVRPCALAIRLCANMVAGHTLIAAILMFTAMSAKLGVLGWGGITLVSCLSAVALTFLELLVAFIQAFVFAFLSTVFLSMSVHPEH
jgi:F-type H+-transporting ATPase subunit a